MNVPEFAYGVIAPTFTVFNEDLQLDEQGQRNLLDFMLQSKAINSFFVRSGMGQMYTFSLDEVKVLAEVACKHVGNKRPVLVGCNGIWDRNRDDGHMPDPDVFLRQAVELSQFAEGVGAAGVVHTIPEAILPRNGETVDDVFMRYFETVSDAVNVPVFVYQPPATHPDYRVTPGLLTKLADLPKVVAIKISNTDGQYLFELCQAVRGKEFTVISGAETAYYAALYAGCRAVIGQGCCVNPEILAVLQKRFDEGDMDGVLEAQASVIRLVNGCRNCVYWLKRYATEKGFPVSTHYRRMPENSYVTDYDMISDDEYHSFTRLFESEMERF